MVLVLHFKPRNLGRLAQSNDAGNVLGTAATPVFLVATGDQRLPRFAIDHQRADTLRATHFVRGEADRIDRQLSLGPRRSLSVPVD